MTPTPSQYPEASASGDTCFYCGRALRRIPVHRLHLRTSPPDLFTWDHIFPQSALRPHGTRIPSEFRRLNKVPACRPCNHAKGSVDPVYWAQQLGGEAVIRLVERIREMGVPEDYIAKMHSGAAILSALAAVGASGRAA